MELALYHPGGGYYSGPHAFAASDDYFTSPAAHPAFGALLGVQLHRMWEALAWPRPFVVIEMGAGNGLLARDILRCAAGLPPDFHEALRYVALDRRSAPQRVSSAQSLVAEGVPFKGVVGCFISNELVDSFPVHRFRIDRGRAREAYVTCDDSNNLVEVLGEPSSPRLRERLAAVGGPLPDGFRGEVNLEAARWMEGVSAALKRGFLVTIDYGHEAEELYSPQRSNGTLRTYYNHTYGANPYERIGKQDITAHVDFSHLAETGQPLGLSTLALLTQAQYLAGLGFRSLLRRLRSMGLAQQERDSNVMAMLELVKQDGLGGFKVLIQEKATGVGGVGELAPSRELVEGLDVPLLDAGHASLLTGKYPHLAWQPEYGGP